jgi:hypothetical protein
MSKQLLKWIILLPLLIIFAACSSLQLPGASSPSGNQPQPNATFSFANQPLESKLAIGTLKLEGTPQAITPEQAKKLLPLWKAVKVMNNSTTTAPTELQGLYKQIEDSMTPEQVTTIKNLNMTGQDFQALMKQYKIQPPQGGQNGFANLSPSERQTRVAQFSSQNGGNNNRNGGFQGGPPGGGPDFFAPGGNTQGNTQRTPDPKRMRAGGRGGGMNLIFVDTIIKLLTERAGS